MGAKANLSSVAARVSNLSGSQPAGPARDKLLRKLLFIRQFAGVALHRDRGQKSHAVASQIIDYTLCRIDLGDPRQLYSARLGDGESQEVGDGHFDFRV